MLFYLEFELQICKKDHKEVTCYNSLNCCMQMKQTAYAHTLEVGKASEAIRTDSYSYIASLNSSVMKNFGSFHYHKS